MQARKQLRSRPCALCAQALPLQPSGSLASLRKAALERFREKKAKRQFAPKVRYVARKKLAEARPRFKGQFVRTPASALAGGSADGSAGVSAPGASSEAAASGTPAA